MAYEQPDHQPSTKLYIGGTWHDSKAEMAVRDLADGGTFATVPAADETDATAAVAVQRAMAETIVREAGKPISSARIEVDSAEERFRRAVADARDRGAQVVRGGDREDTWFEPTLLTGGPREADIVTREQFGPVCPVVPFTDREDAIDIANSGDLALDASVFTSDYDRAMAVADRLDAGAVRIGGAPSHGLADIPYGGNGASGIGREGIGVTIGSFLTTKSIVL